MEKDKIQKDGLDLPNKQTNMEVGYLLGMWG
jgi:hypothetical protein